MFGKVLVGIAVAVLTGGLVYGAINRTNVRSNEAGNGNFGGRLNENTNSRVEEQSAEGQGGGKGPEGGNLGYSGLGESPATGIEGWFEVTGTVTNVDPDSLQILASDNSTVEISRRPWWFAQDQSFSTIEGDEIILTGFLEGDEFETAIIRNLSTGVTISIRDETGRPLWAGNGGSK